MGSSGSMVRLNANAYKDNTAFDKNGSDTLLDVKGATLPAAFQLRYPNFSTVTPFGTTKRMPYLYKYENGRSTAVKADRKMGVMTAEQAKKLQALARRKKEKLIRNLPQKMQNKILKVYNRSVDIKNEITEKLNKTHGGLSYSDFQEKLKEKLKENTKYVSDEDQSDYALYQLAKAGALDQADVNTIMRAGLTTENNNIIVTSTDGASVADAWKTLLDNSGLSDAEKDLLSDKLADTATYNRKGYVRSLGEKDEVYFAEDSSGQLGALKEFLTGGGDTTGNMLPVVMPPKGSKAAQQMFVTFNHGPMDVFGSQQTQLSGGGLMTDSPNLVRSGEEDKAVDKAFEKIKAEEGEEAKNDAKIKNQPFFYLNKEAILLLKGNLAKYAPMLHNFYAQQAEKVKRVISNAQTEVKVGELDESTKKWMTVFAALDNGPKNSFYDDNASKFNDRNPNATAPAIANTDAAAVPLLWDPQSGLAKYDQKQHAANYEDRAGVKVLASGKAYTRVTGYKFPPR